MSQMLLVERDVQALHVWIGPLGMHVFWPDAWKSRPAFCRRWREP